MKIHQLPMGTRFEFEGGESVKTGPMIGTGQSGKSGQRMFPKYSVLKRLDRVAAASEVGPAETVSRADLLKVFEAFYTRCTVLVTED